MFISTLTETSESGVISIKKMIWLSQILGRMVEQLCIMGSVGGLAAKEA